MQLDLQFMAGRLAKQHPNLFRPVKKEDFDAEVRSLRDRISSLTEDETITGLMKIVAYYNMACGYARLGQIDKAFEMLGKPWMKDIRPRRITKGIKISCRCAAIPGLRSSSNGLHKPC